MSPVSKRTDGVSAPRALDHPRREIDADHVRTALVQVACDVTGSAAEIADHAGRGGDFVK